MAATLFHLPQSAVKTKTVEGVDIYFLPEESTFAAKLRDQTFYTRRKSVRDMERAIEQRVTPVRAIVVNHIESEPGILDVIGADGDRIRSTRELHKAYEQIVPHSADVLEALMAYRQEYHDLLNRYDRYRKSLPKITPKTLPDYRQAQKPEATDGK